GVLVDDMQEFGRIRQSHAIYPSAAHEHLMMMQSHQAMARARARERLLEPGQSLRAERAARRARQAAVEQHDTPAAEVRKTAEHERRSVELAPHGLGLVVIA